MLVLSPARGRARGGECGVRACTGVCPSFRAQIHTCMCVPSCPRTHHTDIHTHPHNNTYLHTPPYARDFRKQWIEAIQKALFTPNRVAVVLRSCADMRAAGKLCTREYELVRSWLSSGVEADVDRAASMLSRAGALGAKARGSDRVENLLVDFSLCDSEEHLLEVMEGLKTAFSNEEPFAPSRSVRDRLLEAAMDQYQRSAVAARSRNLAEGGGAADSTGGGQYPWTQAVQDAFALVLHAIAMRSHEDAVARRRLRRMREAAAAAAAATTGASAADGAAAPLSTPAASAIPLGLGLPPLSSSSLPRGRSRVHAPGEEEDGDSDDSERDGEDGDFDEEDEEDGLFGTDGESRDAAGNGAPPSSSASGSGSSRSGNNTSPPTPMQMAAVASAQAASRYRKGAAAAAAAAASAGAGGASSVASPSTGASSGGTGAAVDEGAQSSSSSAFGPSSGGGSDGLSVFFGGTQEDPLAGLREDSDIHDDYLLGEKLGEGAYSVVYRGSHRASGQAVAVKVAPKARMSAPEVRRLMDEVAVMARLQHPHIVRLHAFYEDAGHYYIVTELMTGERACRVARW